MKKQYVLAMVATMGLVGCGGGGGGSDDPGATTGVTAAKLVGTWVQTNESYFESATPGERDWFRTRRQTIIVEQEGNGLSFTNCVSGAALDATLSNNILTFPVQSGLSQALELDVVDAATLIGVVTNPNFNTETDVQLNKVSSDTTIQQASANLTVTALTTPQVSVSRSTWDELCVESQVQAGEYFAAFRAQTTVSGNPVEVGMRFDSTSPFASGTSTYPGAAMDVSGSFDAPAAGLIGELYDPISGAVGISISGSAYNFSMTNLVMQSDQGIDIRINGTISLNSSWLAAPAP